MIPRGARRARVHVATILMLVAVGGSARAQSDDEAAIRHGIALRRELRDAEALTEFRRAYSIRPTARARAQIALAEQALGLWVDAETDLKAALAMAGDAWIRANRATLAASLDEIAGHLGTIELSSTALETTVQVNGAPARGTLPQVVRVEAGTVVIDAESDGYEPLRRTLEVPARGFVRERLVLAPLPVVRSAEPPPAPPSPTVVAPSPVIAVPARPAPSPSSLATWGWIAIGASGAMLVGGVLATLDREAHAQIYEDDTRCPPGQKDAVCGDQKSAAETATALAAVGYVGAAALATTGLILLVKAPGATAHVTAWVAPTGAGLRASF